MTVSKVNRIISIYSCKQKEGDFLRKFSAEHLFRWCSRFAVMADQNQASTQKSAQEMKTELNRSASGEPLPDPKSIHDLTQYVQSLLQQMQDKFQIMSDQILARIDDMGHRIDDLEKNIGDLMIQAGVEETDK